MWTPSLRSSLRKFEEKVFRGGGEFRDFDDTATDNQLEAWTRHKGKGPNQPRPFPCISPTFPEKHWSSRMG